MDVSEQIKRFEQFIEQNYSVDLLEAVGRGNNFIVIDFAILSRFDPELADILLDQPEEVVKAMEIALKNLEAVQELQKKFYVRFKNIPKSQEIKIRDIRSTHIDKFLSVDGIVRQKSDVRPQVTTAKFECPSCGNVISVIQLEAKFKEPSRCGCGRKGKFRLLAKDLVDAQKIVLEEIPELLEGGEQPKRIDVFLKNDLVSPLSDKKTNPGTKIRCIGQVKEVPIPSKDGGKLVRFDLMIDVNFVQPLEEGFGDVAISKEEERQIIELSKDPKILIKLVNSMAPSIYGHEKVKEAIILQLLGGVRKVRTDGVKTRGDMHILLVGDPGAGKSQLIKRSQLIAPKSRYVSGKGASGAGLTAAVVRDEFLRGWALEAGALVLAHRGFCMIDELDKMTKEDRDAMHEALEQQTVSISKANIQATLICETTVLAAANPKWGRFDPYEILGKQIDLPPALISRFDLIFPIRDLPNREADERLAGFVLNLHQTSDAGKCDIDTDILRKYIAYARKNCTPKLTDAALEEIKAYYVQMRNSGGDEGGVKAVPITARQLEALVRLSEASAKSRMADKVSRKDARKAIELLHYCMAQVGVDPDTGKIDVDVLTTGVSSSARNNIIIIKEAINDLENKIGKTIPIEDVVKEAQEKGISADKAEEVIEKLKRSGDIFEPKRGFIQKI
ncbi:minichromosome maintenance protein MCM [Candidatus Woesearchaeota archaeon]|nr:minichromosome maintenance protein MCM [Candidatus Woesearchaeota archaeon]